MVNYLRQLKEKANSHHLMVVAFAILVALMVGLSVFFAVPHSGMAPTHEEIASSTQVAGVVAADPVRLRIPTAQIDAAFEGSLELNKDLTVQVPESYEAVGWYEYGPKPGELGPAVILGHVDSFEGPAVLYRLGQAEVGDEILVDREDGTTAKFEITEMKRYLQSDFPTEDVYGDLDYAGLRVITCTGVYDHGSLRYSHNLVVYARLVEEVNTETDNELEE